MVDSVNLGVMRQSFAGVVWTHKIHEKCSDILTKRNGYMELGNVVLVSLVLMSTVVQLSVPQQYQSAFGYVGLVLTVSEFILLVITLTYGYGKEAVRHKQFALMLLSVREELIAFMGDMVNGQGVSENEAKRNALVSKLTAMYLNAPQQVDGAYEKARDALGVDPATQTGDYTYSDEEIDRFLPEALKTATGA